MNYREQPLDFNLIKTNYFSVATQFYTLKFSTKKKKPKPKPTQKQVKHKIKNKKWKITLFSSEQD